MRNNKLYIFVSLTTISIIVLSGCVTTGHVEFSSHEVSLKMKDQYTLTGKKHLLHDYPPVDSFGNINVVVEITTGTNEKWEVDKTTGYLKWEIKKGKPRVVSYLGYPGNYGMIPRTLLPKKFGGDGDPLDVIIIGAAVPRGSIVSVRPIGVLKLLDDGEQDDKIVAVMLNSELGSVLSIKELNQKFKGVAEILQTWFSNYKGAGRLQSRGFDSVAGAQVVIKTAIKAYRNELSTPESSLNKVQSNEYSKLNE